MKNKFNAALCAFLLSSTASMAYDNGSGTYIYGGLMGVHVPESDVESSAAVSGAQGQDFGLGMEVGVGYKFPSEVRVELQYAGRSNDVGDKATGLEHLGKEQKFTSHAVIANAIYELHPSSKISPYFGAGIGMAHLKNGNLGSGNSFAYQGMAGLRWKATDDMDFAAGYTYFNGGDLDADIDGIGEVTFPYSAHNVDFRVLLNF